MKEIKLTQGKVALVDDEDFEYLNQYKWHANKIGNFYYAVRNAKLAKNSWMPLMMHREIMNTPKGTGTDHKDHNGLNNQKVNLRFCDKKTNAMNRLSNKNSSSEFKGVSWFTKNKNWKSQIQKDGKVIYLGSFKNEHDAALAYNQKATELYGEFANLNNVVVQ